MKRRQERRYGFCLAGTVVLTVVLTSPTSHRRDVVVGSRARQVVATSPRGTTKEQPMSADQLIRENRNISKESLATELNDSRERAQGIINNDLGTDYRKVCANNAEPRTSAGTKEALQRLNIECVDHAAAYSPDLASLNYHLFGRLKEHMRGRRIACDDKLKRTVKLWPTSQLAHFYYARPAKLPGRWQTCSNRGDDYVK